MKTAFCHDCGTTLPSAAKFCQSCGIRVPEILSETTAPGPSFLPEAKSQPQLPEGPNPSALPPDSKEDIAKISRKSDRDAAGWGLIVVGLAVAIFSPIEAVGVHLLGLVLYWAPAFGIWKMSRIAAVFGLLIGVFNIVMLVVLLGKMGSPQGAGTLAPLLGICGYWVVFLYRSVRGTFAYHRYSQAGLCH